MSNFFINQEVIHPDLMVTENPDHQSGAKSIFEGIVRENNLGKSVTSLEYQCYEELAVKEGNLIISEAFCKFDINSEIFLLLKEKLFKSLNILAIWLLILYI